MTKTTKKGFTIIELLIVIVVIGILAAIVTVTYQGVQNRANTTSAAQNAREVAKKAEAYNASKSNFPRSAYDLFNDSASDFPAEAKLGESVKSLFSGISSHNDADAKKPTGTDDTTKKALAYRACIKGTDFDNDEVVGAVVYFWDYEKKTHSDGADGREKPIKVGVTQGTDINCKDF